MCWLCSIQFLSVLHHKLSDIMRNKNLSQHLIIVLYFSIAAWCLVLFGSLSSFFLEHAGELRIVVLIEEEKSHTKTLL
jgi:hypothetical protein